MTKTNTSYRDQTLKNLNALLDSGIDVTLDIRATINVPARTHYQPSLPDNRKAEAEVVIDLAQKLARAKAVIKLVDKNCAELFEENARLQSDIDDLLEKSASPDDKPEPEPDLTPKGAKRKYRPKLTQEQVWAIRRYHKMGRLNIWIARHMKLSASTVWKVVRNQSFIYIPPEPPRKPIKVHVGEGVVENGNNK